MYQLPAVLDRGGAPQLKDELLACLAVGGEVEVDGSLVERASSAGIQLLVALKMQADEEKRDVLIMDASSSLKEDLKSLGLIKFFGITE